jgi:DHA1 family inner membrane transport protein
VGVFALGMTIVLATGMQVRLMDVSADAQTLGAALNHSAFNIANALGAWLGGAVLAAGYGLTAPMWVAVGLTLAGMALFVVAIRVPDRRTRADRSLHAVAH